MQKKKPTVLVVDDQIVNRGILQSILDREYNVIQAENGREALGILEKKKGTVGAILLDIVMPVMDGYEFLTEFGKNGTPGIPIIVLTGEGGTESEEKALEMGAWDFISKPYQPAILCGRLRNAIARSQIGMYDRVKHLAEHDLLTDLYNRQMFYSMTRELLDDNPDRKFALVRFDIDSFNLVNSFWGDKEGDRLLKYIADYLRESYEDRPLCTYGRINSDIFCICMPDDKKQIRRTVRDTRSILQKFSTSFYVKPTFGIYEIDRPEYPVEAMYDRASLAARNCKGKYNQFVGYYDADLHSELRREHQIESDMQKALEEGQFAVYLQPKYDLNSNRPYGAEALVRWKHPEHGLVSPGAFIPVFERNGFISEVDFYMWDHACALLRKWTDEGLNPAPVSVNISRVNMYNPHIVSLISKLIKKHGIPASLLNLELTESAYMDNPDKMKQVVAAFRSEGFRVMMDDFGSGYSSLNTLKDIRVDVLKIDMKFLMDEDAGGRSKEILTSVVRLAERLRLSVIAEGVETREQAEFLRGIGCNYAQGYYFARPLPWQEYETLIRKEETR